MKIKTSKVPIYTIQEEGLVANRDYAEGRFLPAIVINSNTDNYLKEIVEVEVLAPLTIIYTYRQHKIFNKLFRSTEDYKDKVGKICAVLKKGFDGHSFFATDIRFVVLYFDLLQGRLHMPSHILEVICEYPHIEHEDERMRLARPTIRSMEMFTLDMMNVDKRNLPSSVG